MIVTAFIIVKSTNPQQATGHEFIFNQNVHEAIFRELDP